MAKSKSNETTTTTTTPEVSEVETSKAIVLTGNKVSLRSLLPDSVSHPHRLTLLERLQEAYPQGVENLGRGRGKGINVDEALKPLVQEFYAEILGQTGARTAWPEYFFTGNGENIEGDVQVGYTSDEAVSPGLTAPFFKSTLFNRPSTSGSTLSVAIDGELRLQWEELRSRDGAQTLLLTYQRTAQSVVESTFKELAGSLEILFRGMIEDAKKLEVSSKATSKKKTSIKDQEAERREFTGTLKGYNLMAPIMGLPVLEGTMEEIEEEHPEIFKVLSSGTPNPDSMRELVKLYQDKAA
jgi:hypothetical protein